LTRRRKRKRCREAGKGKGVGGVKKNLNHARNGGGGENDFDMGKRGGLRHQTLTPKGGVSAVTFLSRFMAMIRKEVHEGKEKRGNGTKQTWELS